ncbi:MULTISPECIES: PilX N-terminal domain-containing pilus assembly protein [unclassified Pseudomonas]|uniref:pilus assembly PilX family protein n=1 Tax=unclassified Pseudomonas TaxID=196821 RepID=UPI00244CF573|nr:MULTISPECIES: PilX N-terminal domain-containing pilus assembly protein [unclassified Pseudomonas]MDG9922193.1 PilX N-terminal domain-containing pilus assembly protein [Pseudomonas sp. GD04045]MDH0033714.1 PilX N-terminal domain-containing pilus assembly protein [Pseudomonas sp. GD04019]
MFESKQNGSALIICMVFLLLLTILGISSMQSSTMQEKMVGNAVEENRAFQMAEGALREGEQYVESNSAYSSTTAMSLPQAGSVPSGGGWAASTAKAYYHVQKIAYANSVFLITAIGYGIDNNARVVLQSTYRPN